MIYHYFSRHGLFALLDLQTNLSVHYGAASTPNSNHIAGCIYNVNHGYFPNYEDYVLCVNALIQNGFTAEE